MQRDAGEPLDSSALTVAVRAAESCGGSDLATAGGALQEMAHWWSSSDEEGRRTSRSVSRTSWRPCRRPLASHAANRRRPVRA
jgi:hypothetical protein